MKQFSKYEWNYNISLVFFFLLSVLPGGWKWSLFFFYFCEFYVIVAFDHSTVLCASKWDISSRSVCQLWRFIFNLLVVQGWLFRRGSDIFICYSGFIQLTDESLIYYSNLRCSLLGPIMLLTLTNILLYLTVYCGDLLSCWRSVFIQTITECYGGGWVYLYSFIYLLE